MINIQTKYNLSFCSNQLIAAVSTWDIYTDVERTSFLQLLKHLKQIDWPFSYFCDFVSSALGSW